MLLLSACMPQVPDTETPTRVAAPTTDEPSQTDGQTTDPGESPSESPEPSSGPVAGPVPAGLEQFYTQQLAWTDCDGGQCALVVVPLDYREPDSATIELSVIKVAARGDRVGALVFNPGGPGASGVEYAKFAGFIFPGELLESYDLVGFDPRGVGGSSAVDCVDDAELDAFLGSDPTPDDDAERAAYDTRMEDFANACAERGGDVARHVSTPEAARDLDILRAVLGQERLTYYGASYGTYLGATYAALFPDQVGRFVLDGAVDPTLTGIEPVLRQAEGFERAATAYLQDCVDGGDCPLGNDLDTARSTLQNVLASLDSAPVPVEGDTVGQLTEGWGQYGVISAMYAEEYWPLLTAGLVDVMGGDGKGLQFLANEYASRNSDGTYDGTLSLESFYAIGCLEPNTEDDLSEEEVLAQIEAVAPTFARYFAGDSPCAYWDYSQVETVTDFTASGAAPIVVVGTTRDPATPYEQAVSLAELLESGVLVSFDGDGHTAYGSSNDCVDDAVTGYLVDGTVPEDGLSC